MQIENGTECVCCEPFPFSLPSVREINGGTIATLNRERAKPRRLVTDCKTSKTTGA